MPAFAFLRRGYLYGWRKLLIDRLAVVLQYAGYRITDVLDEVPAIRHLNRCWCTFTDPLGIGFGTIPRHDFDPGMLS